MASTGEAGAVDKRKLLARLLQQAQEDAAALVPQVRDARIPLSYAQVRLWLLDQQEPASETYTIATTLALIGELRIDLLQASLDAIAARHEALRTVFRQDRGEPYQVVLPARPVDLPVIDLMGEADPEAAFAAQLARLTAARPFALDAGPLFRVALFRRGAHDHVLALDIHHIISDAWSFKLLTQELAASYTSLVRGEPPALPALPVQFADYALWERRTLRGPPLEASLAYWKQQLAGKLPVLQLPTDRARQARQSHRGALFRCYLPGELTEAVKAFSRDAGVTPFMTLLAAFQTLLHRYTGQDDLLVGSAFAGRGPREVHDLIGFFVNTLPLRVSMAGAPSFAQLLERVRDAALGAYAHQDLPFIRLVQELQPDRDASYTPLVQVMFVMRQRAPAATYALPALTMTRPREVDGGVAKFELSWSMEEEDDRFLAQIEYNADLFTAARIERMAGHFMTLLRAAIRDPRQAIAALPLLTADERRALDAWNPAPDRAPRPCIHRRFEAHAAAAPARVAVVFGDEQLTYAELDARAARLARRLCALGVGPDVRVGLCLERGPAVIVAVLAIFKAGGGYVAIDPALPADRIGFLVEDARMPVVLVQRQTRARIDAAATALIEVDTDAAPGAEVRPRAAERPDQLAYVIYTSGTTGRPKGVEVEHTGLDNLVRAQIDTFGVTPDSRILQFASMSFDASIFEIVMALGAGATLVLAPALTVGRALVALLEHHAVSHATLPPSVLANLPDAALPALDVIISAGEPCPPEVVARWGASRRLFNAYGPTETTVWATVQRCEPGARVTIGRPIANHQVYLLDPALQPVPVGLPGEMYIGGVGLARGYLGRAELTAQRFLQDPFGPPGARLYRTGDIARFLEDGELDFLGRTDDQVKLRGFRIELEEIEAALRLHPGVREAAVVVQGDALDARQLVACYVPGDAEPAPAALRGFLKDRLPSYMVPAAFVALAAFPLTSSNKVDRQALAALEVERLELGGYQPPITALEELVAGVWATVLRVPRVGRHDNFFELGGHSLQATQVMSRIGDAVGHSLPLAAMFERPTVAELARQVDAARRDPGQGDAGSAAVPPLVHLADAASYRLSFAQQRLWLLDLVAPGRTEYIIPTVVELRGPLDRAALVASLAAVVARHESLHTRFVSVDGVPSQEIAPRSLACPVIELGHLAREAADAEVARLALADAQRPFDLTRDLMVRATLLARGAADHVLLLTIHHIAADDRSMRILLEELDAHYRAAIRGEVVALPALAIQYRDFAEWQRRWFTGEQLAPQLAYWRRQLDGMAEPTAVPVDFARPRAIADDGDSVARVLPRALVEALTALGRRESCTLFMTLLAAFKLVLHRYTGDDDIVIGSPVTNRSRRETEHVVGFFGNTLVMRTDLSGRPSFRAVMARVRAMALAAYAHADIAFEEVVDKLGLRHDVSRASLLRTLFAFQDSAPPARLGDAAMTVRETDNKTAKFDLVLFLGLTDDGGLALRAQYDARLYRGETIDRLLGHLHHVLDSVAADPDQDVGGPILLGSDEQAALRAWNATAADFPRHVCLPQLFEAQVARAPDAIAVIWNDRQLTYRALNARANQLAHRLRRLGVGPSRAVGVYMERSIDMIVSILAILKAGGAYAPLDPANPPERIAFMLADARAAVVITCGGAAALSAPDVPVVDLVAERDVLAAERDDDPAPASADVEQLAYILYTSGSTGTPKGVEIPYRAIHRLLFNTNYMRFAPTDRVAHTCSASFDVAIFEIWGALLHGARLIGVDKDVVISPPALLALLDAQAITVLFLTTAVFNLVAQTAPAGLAAIRDVIIAGEAADAASCRAVLAAGRPGRLLNCYGPTEATTFATWYAIAEVARDATSVSIGRPISNTQIHLLDAYGHDVPIGIPGEIFIAGPGVARGYLNRPELTAERFVRDPDSIDPAARRYRTGDLARYQPDGSLEFLGRRDHQVKLRGFRIELGEIEAALRDHPGLADAVVVVREDTPGDKRLVGYVVHANGAEPSALALRQHLNDRLPPYMVPAAFVALDALPLSPNGKVDRKRLLQRRDVAVERDHAYVAPSSALERELAAIWQEVLHLEQVGLHDNFFDLGGSSLLVPQVLSKLNRRLDAKLAPIALFQHPSIAALASFLRQGAAPPPSQAHRAATTDARRTSRARQGERRKKLGP